MQLLDTPAHRIPGDHVGDVLDDLDRTIRQQHPLNRRFADWGGPTLDCLDDVHCDCRALARALVTNIERHLACTHDHVRRARLASCYSAYFESICGLDRLLRHERPQIGLRSVGQSHSPLPGRSNGCLLYTSDAADERS